MATPQPSPIIIMKPCKLCKCYIDSHLIFCSECKIRVKNINMEIAQREKKSDLPFPSLSRWI